MTEPLTSEPSATETTEPTTEPTEETKPSETVDFWRQKAREQEKRAKANADAAKRLSEIEESQKSEAEKTADRIKQLETEAAEARLEATRLEVAQTKGLTPAQARRLVGTTREELEADAASFLSEQKQAVRPSGSVDQGLRGTAPAATPAQEFADFINNQMDRIG